VTLVPLSRAELNVQRPQTAKPEVCPPNERTFVERPVRESAHHFFKADLPFDARKRCAEAKMRCPPEREMPVVLARDVETIGLWEAFWVAVSRCHHGDCGLPLANLLA